MHCMSSKFGVVNSSCFSFKVWTDTRTHTHKITDATNHFTYASAIACVDNK